jgi:hypothetical protein
MALPAAVALVVCLATLEGKSNVHNAKPLHPSLVASYYRVKKGNPALLLDLKHTVPYAAAHLDLTAQTREYDSPQSRN